MTAGLLIRKVLLPVDFDTAWPKLRTSLLHWQPQIAILTGEGKQSAITLETAAHNIRRMPVGFGSIESESPSLIISEFAERLASEVQSSCNVAIEAHPGDYLCNYIYFRCLRELPNLPAVFLHVRPLSESSLPAELEEIKQQANALISAAASVLSTCDPRQSRWG